MSLTRQVFGQDNDLPVFVHNGALVNPLAQTDATFIDMSLGDGWIADYCVCIHCSRLWIGVVMLDEAGQCPNVRCPGCRKEAYPRKRWTSSYRVVCSCGNHWRVFRIDGEPVPKFAKCSRCKGGSSDIRRWPCAE